MQFDGPPVIAGGRLIGDVVDQTDTCDLPGVITDDQLAADWWLRYVVVPTAVGVSTSEADCWWTDGSGDFAGLKMIKSGANFIMQAGQDGGAEFSVTPVFPDVNASYEFVMQFVSSTSHVLLYQNDVLLHDGHLAGLGLAIAGYNALDVYVMRQTDSTPAILEVEAGLGVYS
jgi:hypothetical protein